MKAIPPSSLIHHIIIIRRVNTIIIMWRITMSKLLIVSLLLSSLITRVSPTSSSSSSSHSSSSAPPVLSTASILSLREETRAAFFHSYDSYLTFAYPHDELKPLSCEPRSYLNKTRGTLDDVLGGFMLTLIDSLDSLLVMREFQRFNEALVMIRSDLSFDKDVSVSVFETNIRVLGGLLSAHQLSVAVGSANNITYDGHFLLDLAVDLADRLLPAFDTPTGIPFHVVHLQRGVQRAEVSSQTCPAAGASFLLEMGLLSRLTGDSRCVVWCGVWSVCVWCSAVWCGVVCGVVWCVLR
jgi:hypothetical protein